MAREVGRRRVRREDPPLVTGRATYTDDLTEPGTVHAAVVRSQYAHAAIGDVDTAAAEAIDGVLGVFTAADLVASGIPGVVRKAGPGPDAASNDVPLLASDRVRYAGEAVAFVVATDRYVAHDAADAVTVDAERLPAVTDARDAVSGDAPAVHDERPDNVAVETRFGDSAATARAFETADHVVRLDLHNQRLVPNAMEPRAARAAYDEATGRLTVTLSTQVPHRAGARFAAFLGLDRDRVRVVAPAVGGGFGSKGGAPYSEGPLAAWAAMQLGRPVKWAATRSESHLTDHHGRDISTTASLAVDADGTFRGLRVEGVTNVGAYIVWGSTAAKNLVTLLSGPYAIPAISGQFIGAYTHTVPLAPYRGAGRPEAIYVVERLVDRAAAELGLDPAELRRRNFVPPDAFPYETATGSVYDSGDYAAAMDEALDLVDYATVRDRRSAARDEGRFVGIGVSSFVENTGSGPGRGETARLAFDESGRLSAWCGTADHGQGHGTTFAQLLADELGVPYDDVDVYEGDSDDLPSGTGTFGSRSAAVGGSALVRAADAVREQARRLAADVLEADVADLVFEEGAVHVAGSPARAVPLPDLVERSFDAAALPEGVSPGLAATAEFVPEHLEYAFGTHVAVVEVDPASGEVDLQRYVAVDDVGTPLNPRIVEGQVHGGIAQGLGQALRERAVYDGTGTLLTASFQDYAMPRAADVPELTVGETVTPSPHTLNGAKGVGEGGAIGAPPAVVNAVVDALSPLGVVHVEMPLTAERVWRAVEDAAGD